MSTRQGIFLVGHTLESICGTKLPSNGQLLSTLFYHHPKNKPIRESAAIAVREAMPLCARARIPTRQEYNIVAKLVSLFEEWRTLLKSKGKKSKFQQAKEEAFTEKLKDPVWHGTSKCYENDKDTRRQRLSECSEAEGSPMIGVDKVLAAKEERTRVRKEKEAQRRQPLEEPGPSVYERVWSTDEEEDLKEAKEEMEEEKSLSSAVAPTASEPVSKRARNTVITPRLAAALDRARVSDRNATLILAEAALSFNCSAAEITVNRSTIRRLRKGCRANFAASIKKDFAEKVPLVVHWDGKLLQDLTGKEHVDWLPVLVSGHGVNKLLGVPKLTSGTRENTAAAVYTLLQNWSVANRVKAMCFDTTSSNTGHRVGACILLEQKLERDPIYLACPHHIMELIITCCSIQSCDGG